VPDLGTAGHVRLGRTEVAPEALAAT